MRYILLIAIFNFSGYLFAQPQNEISGNNQCDYNRFKPELLAKIFINSMTGDNIQFYNNWTTGDVVLENGNIVRGEKIRYNMLLDELLWLRKSDYCAGVVYKSTVKEFIFDDKKNNTITRFKKIKLKEWTYLQVLTEGKVSLYVKRGINNVNTSLRTMDMENKFYLKKDGDYFIFSLNARSLIKILKEDKSTIRKIIQDAGLNIRIEEQLIELINRYNSSVLK